MKRLVVEGRDRRSAGCDGSSSNLTGEKLAPSGRRHGVRIALTALLCMASLVPVGCRTKERLPDVGSKTYTDFVSAFYVGLAGLQVGDDVRADAKLQQATELVPAEPAGWVDWG